MGVCVCLRWHLLELLDVSVDPTQVLCKSPMYSQPLDPLACPSRTYHGDRKTALRKELTLSIEELLGNLPRKLWALY